MTQHEGIISKKTFKDWHNVKLFSFQLEGNATWYRTGQVEVSQNEGTNISFTERNGKVDPELIVAGGGDVLPSTAPVASALAAARAAHPGSIIEVLDDNPKDTIGRRIQWQNARADACRLICAALAVEGIVEDGVLPWPKNLAKAKRLDHLTGYINELTKQFVEEETA